MFLYSELYSSLDDSYNDYRAILLNSRREGIKDEKSILEILNINWVLLEKHLKGKNIESIQIFLNSIFKELFEAIQLSDDMTLVEQRNQFEDKINALVDNAVQNYRINSEEYQNNIEQVTSQSLEINYIILEKNNIIKNAENKYPYYYEFLSIPSIEENQLKEILKSIKDAKSKYPVLCSYLDSNKKAISKNLK